MIIVDSREKKWDHIRTYFERSGVPYKDRIKLDAGDYFNPDYPYVVIDRKSGFEEVCANLIPGKDNYHRFVKECRRAFKRRIRLVVLIESKYGKDTDVTKWKSRFSKCDGTWLLKEMKQVSTMYGVAWRFVEKERIAEEILRITHYDNRGN